MSVEFLENLGEKRTREDLRLSDVRQGDDSAGRTRGEERQSPKSVLALFGQVHVQFPDKEDRKVLYCISKSAYLLADGKDDEAEEVLDSRT